MLLKLKNLFVLTILPSKYTPLLSLLTLTLLTSLTLLTGPQIIVYVDTF